MDEVIANIDAQYRTPRATACQWGPEWLAKSPQLQQSSTVTADSTAATLPAAEPFPTTANGPAEQFFGDSALNDYSEWCWTQISAADYRYLTQPRNYPSPCPWCGGRLVHNPLCNELRRSWQPTLPFGKHKGKTLPEVPRDYLEWFVTIEGIDSELRASIRHHLADVPR